VAEVLDVPNQKILKQYKEGKKNMKKSLQEQEVADIVDDIYFEGFPSFIENDVVVTYDGEKYLGFIKEFYTDGKIMSVIAEIEDFYVFAVLQAHNKKVIIAEALNSYKEAKRKFIENQS
jgi:hypothetical protein